MSDVLGPGSMNGLFLLAGCGLLVAVWTVIALIALWLGSRRAAATAVVLLIANLAAAGLAYWLLDTNGPWHDGNQTDWVDWALAPWFLLCGLAFFLGMKKRPKAAAP